MDWGRKWLVGFKAGKPNSFHLTSLDICAVDVKMDVSVLEKNSFQMMWLNFSFKLDWSSYIMALAKNASKKVGALICSMKILAPETAVFLYKFTIRSCMEYCCHVWAGTPGCFLEFLDKLQEQICRAVGPLLAASLEPLTHCRNVASLSLFCTYYFGRCSSELVQLVPVPFSWGRCTHYSDRLDDVSV